MELIELTVNGIVRSLHADPQMPLAHALRDRLGLTGTKISCGAGVCGACTVHIDGVAERSCSIPLGAVRGCSVVTIEGLAAAGDHPLQRAWRAEQVPQCGFCQPGQIMQAAALLERPGVPTAQEIRDHMSGNLCRCGTYGRILRAVARAARERAGSGG